MSLHTFHGHFFVRSTDLLSLPNVNPDAGFGMQVSFKFRIIFNYLLYSMYCTGTVQYRIFSLEYF
jgi:hypothetical protein